MPPSISASSTSSESAALDLTAPDGWDDVEPDQEKISVVSLFDDKTFPTVGEMLEYCKGKYSFDLATVVRENGYTFYDCIKVVNYIRTQVRAGNSKPDITSSKAFLQDDAYLQPVLEDDALLFSLDEVLDLAAADDDNVDAPTQQNTNSSQLDHAGAIARVAELEAQLRRTTTQFAEYRSMAEKTLDARWNAGVDKTSTADAEPNSAPAVEDDSHYFASYAYNDIHEVMLKDTTRTDAYRDFIYANKALFAGKTVLDVGCGTGILSLFCARAGAARVIAVDNSDIILKARAIAHENGLDDIITCVRGRIEDVVLPVERVDVLVSEWMGYCLLYEAMLESVLWARDRYLVPGGLMVPGVALLQLAPVADPDWVADSIAFWHGVYGFRMAAMLERVHDDVVIRSVAPDAILGPVSAGVEVRRLDLHSVTAADVRAFTAPFDVVLARDADALDAWAVWFDIIFPCSRDESVPAAAGGGDGEGSVLERWRKANQAGVAFTTGPTGPETHWRSGFLLIDHGKRRAGPVKKGQRVKGSIAYAKRKGNSRELEIEVEWVVEGTEEQGKQMWVMQ